jgi:capsular polysaccharide biosynthesis protein
MARMHSRHWLGLLVMTLIGVTVGYGWALQQTPEYVAEATGNVVSQQSTAVVASRLGDAVERSWVEAYLEIAGWRVVAENTIDDLELDTSPEALGTRVSATNPHDTVLNVSARANTPEDARDLADTWLRAMTVTMDSVAGDGTEDSAPVTLVAAASRALPTTPSYPGIQTAVLVGGVLGLGFGIVLVRADLRRLPRPGK